MTDIFTLDLDFQGIPETIASYLIPHSEGAILIESGPGSNHAETFIVTRLKLQGVAATADIKDLPFRKSEKTRIVDDLRIVTGVGIWNAAWRIGERIQNRHHVPVDVVQRSTCFDVVVRIRRIE